MEAIRTQKYVRIHNQNHTNGIQAKVNYQESIHQMIPNQGYSRIVN